MATRRFSVGVVGEEHLAHPTRAEPVENLVRTEA